MSTPEKAVQMVQTLALILDSPQNPVDLSALADYIMREFGVDDADRKRILG